MSFAMLLVLHPGPAQGQVIPHDQFAPIPLRESPAAVPEQNVPNPSILPTDQTPTPIGKERELGYGSELRFKLLHLLPSPLYFSSTTEVTQRFESNVLSTASHPRRDYAFRVLPNTTLGYYVLPRTMLYGNYFMIKDVFARTPILNQQTFHSVSGGLQHDIPIGHRTNLQLNFQIRELYQARKLHQADMLPAFTVTRAFRNFTGFANVQLQLRSRNIFQGYTREIDPFYTLGLLYRIGDWNFTSTGTLVNSWRNQHAIPHQTNFSVICDFEVSRPVMKRIIPGVNLFVRAEPIWNWDARSTPGLSGFDFRLFGGLRATVVKPAIHLPHQKLKKQLREGHSPIPQQSSLDDSGTDIKTSTANKQDDALSDAVSRVSQVRQSLSLNGITP